MTEYEKKRKKQMDLIVRLEGLSDDLFIDLFRSLLNKEQYPYGNKFILDERLVHIYILFSDLPEEKVVEALVKAENTTAHPEL